jgi:Raf kinase inhibitor-like YbhB/YbcL family protein
VTLAILVARRLRAAAPLLIACLTACIAGELPPPTEPSAGGGPNGGPSGPSTPGEEGMAMILLTSTAFADGEPIPRDHTGEGDDLSPLMTWTGLPPGTKSLALVCDDPDAPTPRPWVHWVIYNIPADAGGLPEGLPRDERLSAPEGALQGKNSWPSDNVGYRGPMPPPGSGRHRYDFKLYALDAMLNLEPAAATKESLEQAMRGRVLGQGQLVGTYER